MTDFTINSKITEGGITLTTPKQAKGAVFAQTDIKLIIMATSPNKRKVRLST